MICKDAMGLAGLAFLLSSVPLAGQGAKAPQIPVRVDPRVELLSTIFYLAGNPEYGKGRVAAYSKAVDEHFGDFRSHRVVKHARSLRRISGVSYDACMSMAVHMGDTKDLKEVVPFDRKPRSLEKRWKTRSARTFLKHARDFVKKTRFSAFVKQNEKLYATAAARMQKVLAEDAGLEWFDGFFGARPTARFELALGLLNGGHCYGPRLQEPDGQEILYCILGVWATDEKGLPRFDSSMLSTVVHEFCHSYCNPLVDKHAGELEGPAKKLWPAVADAMRSQAYGTWQTMMRESLVRAAVVRYVAKTQGEAAAAKAIASDHQRQFLWVGELSEVLAEYEKERKKYKTVDAFFGRIVAFFESYAVKFAKREATVPRVLSMLPKNGARDVDPKCKKIVVTFSLPMVDGSWSFVGGGPHFPETTGDASYDRARKVITLPVRLKPNWEYEFWLNRGRFSSFRSQKGGTLRPVHVKFKTGG